MELYLNLLENAGLIVYIVIGLFVLLFGWWGYMLFRGERKKKLPGTDLPVEDYETISKEIKGKQLKGRQPDANIPKIRLGEGNVKCLCFRKIKGVPIADFTTTKEPIGEEYQFDPSCPFSGAGYIAQENDEGDVIDYDPRQVEYVLDDSPEYAWFAISWDIVKEVFFVPVQWWKSTSVWFAGAMIAVVFITSLAVLG